MNLKTVLGTKAHLEANGITPRVGITILIYSCGHCVHNPDDPLITRYFPKLGCNQRACPVCEKVPKRLVQKFKLNHDGSEVIGLGRRDSLTPPKVYIPVVKEKKPKTVRRYKKKHYAISKWTMPVNVFSLADAHAKGVDCIPCENLFRFNASMAL